MLSSNLFWNLVIIVGTMIEWGVLKFIGDNLLESKKVEKTKDILLIIPIVSTTILTSINVSPNIKLIIAISIGCIIYMYNYRCKFLKALILNLAYWMILIGLEFISINFTLFINSSLDIQELFKSNIFKLELMIISKTLLISIIPIVKSFNNYIRISKKNMIYIMLPMIANILSIAVIFQLSMECVIESNIHKIMLVLVSTILVLSNLSLIKIISNMIKSNNIKIENKVIREKIDMQYKQYLAIQQSQIKVRKLYHDMKNHVNCIEKMNSNNIDSNEYIKSIKNELENIDTEISTGNMILDIIVNEKKEICSCNNISLDIDINFTKCNFIDMVDICSIFSNMLDNAIEANMKVDKNRYIKLKGSIVNKFFVVKCENPKKNSIKLNKGTILTNKNDKFIHGLGIKSIKSSVKKYDGELSIDFTDEKFVIKIYIPIINCPEF